MTEAHIAGLDAARYGRWLARAGGPGFLYGACDAQGHALWCSDGDEGALAALLADVAPAAWDASAGVRQLPLNGSSALWLAPVGDAGAAAQGFLVAVARRAPDAYSTVEIDQLAEALEDASTAMREAHRSNVELDGMARELSDRYEELHLVYEIDRQLAQQEIGREVLQRVLDSCAQQMGVDVAAFVRPGDGAVVHATNLSQPIHNLDLVLVEMRGDLYRFIHSSRQTVVLNEARDPRRAYIFTDMNYRILACPIYQGAEMPAILVMLRHAEKQEFSNSDRRLGEIMAHQLSALMHMQDMLGEMRRFTEQMAAALIEAVEAKDPYTRGHSERVHFFSMEIGRALDLPEPELDDLFWGSLLHDVGKIGIPDAVLCKPGRLTPDEYTFIMVHPERSYEILRHVDRLQGALPGARHHQEKFDGTGYPHRLKGKNIPLHARIIAVADTYDSITSSRAYRPGRTHEEALREIERVSGTQLDPEMVAVFKRVCATEPGWLKTFGIRREHERH